MMFTNKFHPGIQDGTITVSYRYWKRPQAVAGNTYKINPIGHIRMLSVTTPEAVTRQDLPRTGFLSLSDLSEFLEQRGTAERRLYRLEFVYLGHRADLEPDRQGTDAVEELEQLDRLLTKKDQNSGFAWTRPTLQLIGEMPGASSAVLASILERDRAALKKDVRKLKQLGLTVSLEVGYQLSAKGLSYLAWCNNSAVGG